MAVNREDYAFEIDIMPVYISLAPNNLTPVKILNRPRLAVVRADTGDVLDIVSDHYEGVTHDVVVDSVKDNIIPQLGWNITDEHLCLWMNGGIMFYSMQTENAFQIDNNTTLYATINAVNSHNRYTKAGVHITLQDQNGTNYLPTSGSKSVYTYESMLHRKSTLNILQLHTLIDSIPVLINTTVSNWQNWVTQHVSFNRLYILAQLFNYQLAMNIIEKMPTGGNRFELYKHICQYMLNKDKMSASGFNALTVMSKFVNVMKRDSFFTCSEEELKNEIRNKQIFSWEDKVKTTEEKEEEINDSVINVSDVITDEEINVEEVSASVEELIDELI